MIPSSTQAVRYLDFLSKIFLFGTTVSPRGLEIKEIEDTMLLVDPHYPFMTFDNRKYNIDYFKKEMLWKLTADRFNDSIKQHAKMWESVQNPDGSFNSNYGQYWWGPQQGMNYVIHELKKDPASGRAVIPVLNVAHLASNVRDTVCTECIGFRLRPYVSPTLGLMPAVVSQLNEPLVLNMSVHMRSSDVIFGLGTDIPTFAFLYRMVFGVLTQVINHPIHIGSITISAMSSHIYSRHYDMVGRILSDGVRGYRAELMPWIDGPDAMVLASSRGDQLIVSKIKDLGEWLCR